MEPDSIGLSFIKKGIQNMSWDGNLKKAEFISDTAIKRPLDTRKKMMFRVSEEELAAIEKWTATASARRGKVYGREEALRELVARGLQAKPRIKPHIIGNTGSIDAAQQGFEIDYGDDE